MPRVTTRNGLHLFVEDLGAGKPLLLVHGFTGSSEAWGRELGIAAPVVPLHLFLFH